MKPGWPGVNGRQTQDAMKQTLYTVDLTCTAVETFYQGYRDNFIAD